MSLIYFEVIEPNLLYGVVFRWTAFYRRHNVGHLDRVKRSAAIGITAALRTNPTKALVAMVNWFPNELFAKQVAKFPATRLNALSRWCIVPYGYSSILNIDPVAPLDINCLHMKY